MTPFSDAEEPIPLTNDAIEGAALRACWAFPRLRSRLSSDAFHSCKLRLMFQRLVAGTPMFVRGERELYLELRYWQVLDGHDGANPQAVYELARMHAWRLRRDALLRAAAAAERMDDEGMRKALAEL